MGVDHSMHQIRLPLVWTTWLKWPLKCTQLLQTHLPLPEWRHGNISHQPIPCYMSNIWAEALIGDIRILNKGNLIWTLNRDNYSDQPLWGSLVNSCRSTRLFINMKQHIGKWSSDMFVSCISLHYFNELTGLPCHIWRTCLEHTENINTIL